MLRQWHRTARPVQLAPQSTLQARRPRSDCHSVPGPLIPSGWSPLRGGSALIAAFDAKAVAVVSGKFRWLVLQGTQPHEQRTLDAGHSDDPSHSMCNS